MHETASVQEAVKRAKHAATAAAAAAAVTTAAQEKAAEAAAAAEKAATAATAAETKEAANAAWKAATEAKAMAAKVVLLTTLDLATIICLAHGHQGQDGGLSVKHSFAWDDNDNQTLLLPWNDFLHRVATDWTSQGFEELWQHFEGTSLPQKSIFAQHLLANPKKENKVHINYIFMLANYAAASKREAMWLQVANLNQWPDGVSAEWAISRFDENTKKMIWVEIMFMRDDDEVHPNYYQLVANYPPITRENTSEWQNCLAASHLEQLPESRLAQFAEKLQINKGMPVTMFSIHLLRLKHSQYC